VVTTPLLVVWISHLAASYSYFAVPEEGTLKQSIGIGHPMLLSKYSEQTSSLFGNQEKAREASH
ncbi:MAG: hypothetical protein KDE45_19075, partial [Caldilineaceae bacterium]|nr:hypothetical protein [Caldilineaceae bacterium]